MAKLRVFMSIIIVILFSNCGGTGPGSPGSSGTADTNVVVMVDMMPSQFGIGYTMDQEKCQLTELKGSPDYNVNLSIAQSHVATLFIKAMLISPIIEASPLFVEKYTVTYRATNDSIGAPPIAEAVYRNYSFTIMPPPVSQFSTTNCRMVFPAPDIIFFDTIRKVQYLSDVRSGKYSYTSNNYLNRYTATFKFEGKNADGKEFSFVTQSDFQIGLF